MVVDGWAPKLDPRRSGRSSSGMSERNGGQVRIVESEREVRGVLGWGWDGDTLVEAAGWVDGGGVCGDQIGRVVIGGVSEHLRQGVRAFTRTVSSSHMDGERLR